MRRLKPFAASHVTHHPNAESDGDMAFKLVPIKPKGRDYKKLITAVEEAMQEAADEGIALYEQCTSTWSKQPHFEATAVKDGYIIGTDDEIFQYVDEGTPPHIITPKRAKVLAFGAGGTPKSQPGVIGSRGGSRGSTKVFAHLVHHPGTEARNFTELVHKRTQDVLPVILAQKIGGALGD